MSVSERAGLDDARVNPPLETTPPMVRLLPSVMVGVPPFKFTEPLTVLACARPPNWKLPPIMKLLASVRAEVIEASVVPPLTVTVPVPNAELLPRSISPVDRMVLPLYVLALVSARLPVPIFVRLPAPPMATLLVTVKVEVLFVMPPAPRVMLPAPPFVIQLPLAVGVSVPLSTVNRPFKPMLAVNVPPLVMVR